MNGPLSVPVVIPQQRPGSQERGFMAAYAPSLEAAGIDRKTFLHFVDDCNNAFQGNKFLAGVQVVSFGVGFTPEVIVMGVSTAVQLGAHMANKGFVKHKTNTMLDKYNEELFGPRGLYCMIMKYDPNMPDPDDARQQKSSAGNRLGSMAQGQSWLRDPVSGKIQGQHGLPSAVAPLVYMDNREDHKQFLSTGSVDRSVDGPQQPQNFKSKAKNAFDNFNDYLDRRARAKYAAENQGDILSTPVSKPFSNRFLDPNSTTNNGGFMGFITGGAMAQDPETRKRKKHARIDEEERRVLDEYHDRMDQIRNQNQSRREVERQLKRLDEDYQPRLAVFRDQRKDVEKDQRAIKNCLYLTIVNKPTEAEMAAANAKMDQAAQYGQQAYVHSEIGQSSPSGTEQFVLPQYAQPPPQQKGDNYTYGAPQYGGPQYAQPPYGGPQYGGPQQQYMPPQGPPPYSQGQYGQHYGDSKYDKPMMTKSGY